VLGICVMYSVLGVAAGLTGGLFGSALQNPFVSIGLGVLLVALSLSMFGVYEMQAPAWVLDRAAVANTGSVVGIFLSGLAVGVIAAPCVGPFVLAVLAIIAQRGSALFGLQTMFTLSLGLGLPYLFLAAFSNLLQRLPRSGEWMEWVKKFFGVLLASLGLRFALLGVAPALAEWVLPAALMLGGLYLGFMEKSANEHGRFRLMKRVAGAAGVIAGVALVVQMTSAHHRALVARRARRIVRGKQIAILLRDGRSLHAGAALVVRRAAAEVEFRAVLFADPAAALAGYDLSAAERAALTGLTAESFDALAGELEARMSKSAFGGEIPEPAARGQSL